MKAKRKSSESQASGSSGTWGCAVQSVITLLVLLIIGYVLVLLAARTEGFKYTVEDRLSERWGLPVTVSRIWVKPDGVLVMEGVEGLVAALEGAPGIAVNEIQVRWSLWGWVWPGVPAVREVGIRDGQVTFQQDEEGVWQPGHFALDAERIWDWVRAPDGTDAPEPQWSRPVHVDGLDLRWLDAAGQPLRVAESVDLQRERAVLRSRLFVCQDLSADRVFEQGREQPAVERVFLWIDGEPVKWP